MTTGTKIDVELLGGPFDGHQDEVTLKRPGFDVWLYTDQATGKVFAYVMSGTTCREGKRWVLRCWGEVAKVGTKKSDQ
jgi:hypothetical protein